MKINSIALSLLAGVLSTSTVFADTTITGAGATFPYPVYAKWAEAFQKDSNIQINYQPIGSGGGIQQIEAGTVDFGASDKPLTADELNKNGLIMFPTVLGAVVPVINLPNVKVNELKLSGPVLADIFLGKIKKWSDPALAQLNPGIKLPDQDIAVVHRSDGSGTSYLFTNYLSKVSADWAKSVGSDTSVQWPVGVGGKGNEGVSLYVSQIPGSIGYVEYAYALSNHLAYPALQNKENAFVVPTKESVAAAASFADWNNPADPLTNEPGIKSWPITGATFILMHGLVKEADKEKALATLSFFDWAYHHGADSASELNYVMLPNAVITNIQQNWKSQFKDEKGQPVWSK